MQNFSDRIYYADILRIMSIMGVIIIHVGSEVTYRFNSVPLEWWIISDVFNSIIFSSGLH